MANANYTMTYDMMSDKYGDGGGITLRGDAVVFKYLDLRRNGSVSAFVDKHPEYQEKFDECWSQIMTFVAYLCDTYRSCYIEKDESVDELSSAYIAILRDIHSEYSSGSKCFDDASDLRSIVWRYVVFTMDVALLVSIM